MIKKLLNLSSQALVLSVAISACGDKAATPLSDTQKATLTDVMKSVSSSTTALKSGTGSLQSQKAFAIQKLIQSNAASKPQTEEDDEVKDAFEEALTGATCTSTEPDQEDLASGNFSFELSGDDCPVTFSMSITSTGSITFEMEVKDTALAAKLDVTKVAYTFTVSGSQSSATFSGTGTITSKQYGAITVTMTGSMTTTSVEVTQTIAFADFSAVIAATLNTSTGVATYTLNGVAITEEEFAKMSIETIDIGGSDDDSDDEI